jgi:hypothetical protein
MNKKELLERIKNKIEEIERLMYERRILLRNINSKPEKPFVIDPYGIRFSCDRRRAINELNRRTEFYSDKLIREYSEKLWSLKEYRSVVREHYNDLTMEYFGIP